jgi:hypothetical protein
MGFPPTIDRILRGALHNAEKCAMSSAALDRALEARKRSSNSISRSKSQVKMDGPIYVGDVRRHMEAENAASIERRWRSTAKKHRQENSALMKQLGVKLDETPTSASSSRDKGAIENLFYIDLHGDPQMASS